MQTLVDLLKDASDRFGPSPALVITPGFRQERWSYDKLWETSGKVAGYLRDQGLEKGDRALLWAPNRPEWVAAFFGCLRAGVMAVPLDARSAPDFVERIVQRTEPKLAFHSRFTSGDLPDAPFPVVPLEELEDLVEQAAPMQEAPALSGADIAEVMFTSGTTGDPKGVVLTHRNILSNVQAVRELVLVKPSYRLLSLAPLSHMLEQTGGMLVPISSGATVVYPVSRQPSIIFKTLKSNKITNIVLVPRALQLFMNAIEREVRARGKEKQWQLLHRVAPRLPVPLRRLLFRAVHRKMGGQIRFFMSGGAYLDPEVARKWKALGIPVLQGYGTTETAPVISTNTFSHEKPASVGKVLPGQEVKVADDGEVLTRGPNVTPGYWQDPEATAASFDGEWYRTGDLGYFDQDGFLYLKGRKKDLIVLANGQNVYPEDIETALTKQPGVRDGVVVGLPKDGGDVEVHAVLLLEDGASAPELVRGVNSQMAGHQQIQGTTVWPEEDFPRTHTLKVKKPLVIDYLLNRTEQEPETPQETPEKAQSGLQRIVASVCSISAEELTPEKTLGLDLNIDSLGRVELLSAIEQELGVFVDETQVGPETALGELEAMVQSGSKAEAMPLPGWGRALWARLLRVALQSGVIFPALRLFYSIKVYGREHLKGLDGPVLFASNHNVMMDGPMVLYAIPGRWRWRLCPAAEASAVFGRKLRGIAVILLSNGFPFAREGSIRASLEHLGQLLDSGWSILIFPEADKFLGKMKPFKSGTGLIACQGRTSAVPIRVKLIKDSVFDRPSVLSRFMTGHRFSDHEGVPGLRSLFSRGKVEIHIGEPLTFPRRTDFQEATARLESAVRAL